MWMQIGTFVTFALACLSGIVWAIRLEGKVNEHDQLFEERKAQANTRAEADATRFDDLKDHLIRIENKLDSIAYSTLRTQQAPPLHG